jgi:sigma-B regulation protein RsbU (phosphoserine phosphatase)
MLLIISSAVLTICYFTYENAMNNEYERTGTNIAKTVTALLDSETVAQFSNGVVGISEEDAMAAMESEEYAEIISTLRAIKDSHDLLYLYMVKPMDDGTYYYLFDSDESEEVCPYGYNEAYYPGVFDENKDIFLAGKEVEPMISNEDFGWIITVNYPYHAEGEFLGYISVDISMDYVVSERLEFLYDTMLIMITITALFAVIYIVILNKTMVSPIKKMANAAKDYINTKTDASTESSSISELKIKTGDEIEQLCVSLQTMEHDINAHIENLRTVTAEKERIGAELDVAKHIQASMLPCSYQAFPDRKEFDIYATMEPAKEVGGDFYDFFMVDDRHLAIVMADVSGKGVPAALFMVIGKTLIKDHTTPGRDLGKVFTEVNDLLCESNSEELFITAFEGVLDLVTGEFVYVNAGHEMPFIYKSGGNFEPYKIRAAFVLAGMEGMKYRAGSMMLEPGDKIFQYTDGVTEATNINNELYGMDRLGEILNKVKLGTPHEILPAIKKDIDEFVGEAPQFDDITMLCLEYKTKMEIKEEDAQ